MDMCVQILLQQMSAMQQHQQNLNFSTPQNRGPGPELKSLAALSQPVQQVQSRLLQLPTCVDSQSSAASSGLQIVQPVASADSQQLEGPSPISPAQQELHTSLQKMNSSASVGGNLVLFDPTESDCDCGHQVAAPLSLLNIDKVKAEMSTEVSVAGGARRLADVPTHRPADVSIVAAHRLADAPSSSGAHVANERIDEQETQPITPIEPVAPLLPKASQMLQEFADMQDERALRKREASKTGCKSESLPQKSAAGKASAKASVAKAAAKKASSKAAAKKAASKAVAKKLAKAEVQAAAKVKVDPRWEGATCEDCQEAQQARSGALEVSPPVLRSQWQLWPRVLSHFQVRPQRRSFKGSGREGCEALGRAVQGVREDAWSPSTSDYRCATSEHRCAPQRA